MEKRIRVLLIDDHTLFRSGIKALLQRQPGFEVVGEAGDALEGVKRAKTLQPDVVLLDIHMPGMDGPTFLAAAARVAPRTRAILMSGRLETEALLRAINGPGVFRCLPKPIETSTLVATLEEAWNAFRAQSA